MQNQNYPLNNKNYYNIIANKGRKESNYQKNLNRFLMQF